ncbi:MAG TPA: 5'/3'-nucleotidase SurE, partial [Candidatus Obscuribacterales bacterium]
RSIAVSLFWGEKRHFDVAAEIISRFLPVMEKAPLKERSLYNINVPNVPLAEIKGVRATEAGIRLYNDFFEKRIDPRGKVYYWLTGHAIDQNESEKSDVFAVLNNFVSITPVAFNMTDHQALEMISALSFLKESSISDEPGTKLSGNKSAGGASGARQGGLAG